MCIKKAHFFLCSLFYIFIFHSVEASEIKFETALLANKSQLLLLIPNNELSEFSQLFLKDKNLPIDAKFTALNLWPKAKGGQRFVRLLLIDLYYLSNSNISLTLAWESSKTKLGNFAEIAQDVQLIQSQNGWLREALLLQPKEMQVDDDWYVEPQIMYANYVTNTKLLTENSYPPQKASQWLFDRPRAIYQLFIMSEDKRWFKKANALSDFYINQIDNNGQFKLIKKIDPKYSSPVGLLHYYLLTGERAAKHAIKKLYNYSLAWQPTYTSSRGFWTERHQASALLVAVIYWELTNSPDALDRVHEIINATANMTFNPVNDWPLRNCPQHSLKSHEGINKNIPVCSPWMMALLSDALWRFYRLTGDEQAAALIDVFGDFVLNHGIFYGESNKVKGLVMPKYLSSMDDVKEDKTNQWTDSQHVCDVATLIARSLYIKKQNNKSNFILTELFSVFTQQCKAPYYKLKANRTNSDYWSLRPPRRFGWTYSTTSDLPWLSNIFLPKN